MTKKKKFSPQSFTFQDTGILVSGIKKKKSAPPQSVPFLQNWLKFAIIIKGDKDGPKNSTLLSSDYFHDGGQKTEIPLDCCA